MAKRIKRYIAYVDALLERDDIDVKKEMDRHLVQIGFFMHERLPVCFCNAHIHVSYHIWGIYKMENAEGDAPARAISYIL